MVELRHQLRGNGSRGVYFDFICGVIVGLMTCRRRVGMGLIFR